MELKQQSMVHSSDMRRRIVSLIHIYGVDARYFSDVTILNYDQGTEFMAEFAEMITKDYGITRKGSTVRNPQSNAMIE